MRLFGIGLVLAGALASAPAQTNAPANARQLSLQDAIELALKNNLDLQISRYTPQIALFNLRANYGAYDPTFSVAGDVSHEEAGSQLLGGGFTIPGSVTDSDSFSSSLNGLLPWGTTYSLGTTTPITDTWGSTPTVVDNPNAPISLSTNSLTVIDGGTINNLSVLSTNFAQVRGNRPFENSRGAVGLSVAQPLLKNFWIDSARLNIRVARNRLRFSELGLKTQVMDTVTQVEQTYYDLVYFRENITVQEKALEAAQRLAAETRRKVEVGALAPLDQQSAESEAATREADVIAARSNLAIAEDLMKQLITSQYSSWAGTSIETTGTLAAPRQPLNLQDSWSKAMTFRPELVQARLDIERVGIQLKFDKNQLFPELDAIGTIGYSGSGREFSNALDDLARTDRPFWVIGGRLNVPLARTAARNSYKADKAVMEQTVLNLKRLERDIMVAVDNDIRQARSSFEQVAARRKAREFAESDLSAEQKKLESGKSTTYTVLQKQRDLTTARGNEIQALTVYNKALAKLSRDEGTTLDRLGVNWEAK